MKNKVLKYSIKMIFLSILFFILFNIRKEDGIKENTVVEKVVSKTNINLNQNSITEEQQSTTNEQIVEKEYIETEFNGYKVSAKMYIPKINLETYVLEKYSKQALLTSVTKFYGGEPNQIGNFCIAGHNYGTSNMFQNLKNLNIGDEIFLVDTNGNKVKYTIYDIYKVLPNQTQCLSQQTNGKVELTLITCTLDSEKRIIVKARKG